MQRKKKALKALFTRKREVPIIYNRNSKLFRKYLKNREKLSRNEEEEQRRAKKNHRDVGNAENEVEDFALQAPPSSAIPAKSTTIKTQKVEEEEAFLSSKSEPGLSLEEQLRLLTLQQAKAGPILVEEGGVGGEEHIRPQREEQPGTLGPVSSLHGSFIPDDDVYDFEGDVSVGFPTLVTSAATPQFFARPTPLPVLPTPSASFRSSSSLSLAERSPLKLKGVYEHDGVLFRKPVQQQQQQDQVPQPSFNVPEHTPAAFPSGQFQQPQQPIDIFNPSAVPTDPPPFDPTLFRTQLGTTGAPSKKDKNIRFLSPELVLTPPRPEFPSIIEQDALATTPGTTTAKKTAAKPNLELAATTPLPSLGEPVVKNSLPPPGGVYYKPADPEAFTPGEVYYKPFHPTEEPPPSPPLPSGGFAPGRRAEPERDPKSLFDAGGSGGVGVYEISEEGYGGPGQLAGRPEPQSHQNSRDAPPSPSSPAGFGPQLVYGFQPVVRFEDEPAPQPLRVVPLNGAFRTVYSTDSSEVAGGGGSRPVRFPQL